MPITTSQLAWMLALLDDYHMLAADLTERHGAYFLRNDDAPHHYDGNQVRHIRHTDDIDALFRAVDDHYADREYRALRTDWFTPPAVEARLMLEGYEGGAEIVMATAEPPRATGGDFSIREVSAVSDELAGLVAAQHGVAAAETLTLIRRRGAGFAWYVACEGERPIGHLSLRTKETLGYLESLFVLPEYRMRGAASALILHTDAAARAAGADLTFLPTWYADTPRLMYARMGFEPVFVFRHWLKRFDVSATRGAGA